MKDISIQEAQALLDICPVAMLLVGDSGNLRGFNRAFAALVGGSAATLLDASQPDGLLTPLLGTDTIVNWIMPDGDERWLAVETVTIDDMPGVNARFYLDITEKLRLKKERDALALELQEQSLKDPLLTSLLSRHGILLTLGPLVARSRRYNSPLSIVTMKIEADREREKALTKIAFLLNDQTRWADVVGCDAGHDFIMILQETTQDSALLLVEKLAGNMARMNAAGGNQIRSYYGVTQCQNNDNAESMLERAESALTEARQNDTGTSIAL
jgi:diguanylate cyclase (GGDEF)-like protein